MTSITIDDLIKIDNTLSNSYLNQIKMFIESIGFTTTDFVITKDTCVVLPTKIEHLFRPYNLPFVIFSNHIEHDKAYLLNVDKVEKNQDLSWYADSIMFIEKDPRSCRFTSCA